MTGASSPDFGRVQAHWVDLGAGRPEQLEPLSADERERAARFHFERHRRRFVACRFALRTLLAERLGASPAEVRFLYGAHGKPRLAPEHAASRVTFNVSHAEELGLIVLAHGVELGCDVEHVDPKPDVEALARTVFSTTELAELTATPPEARRRAFYRGWTRKEAFVKALGSGLSHPLKTFAIPLAAADGPLGVRSERADTRRWRIHVHEPWADFVAAIALEGEARVSWEAAKRG